MSSTEAELIALADLAIELIYVKGLLEFIGHTHVGPIEVSTDNKGAYDLCHRFTSAQNSHHIERKVFMFAISVNMAHAWLPNLSVCANGYMTYCSCDFMLALLRLFSE